MKVLEENKIIHAYLLYGVYDKPARAIVNNTIASHGYYGCVKCTQRTYEYQPDFEMRSDENYESFCNEAQSNSKKKACFGIKGSTCLTSLKFYSVCNSTQIDFMHSVGLGVIKDLFTHWFDMVLGPYSLRDHLVEIDVAYINLTPPDYLPDVPRSVTEWKIWKAKEFINFILFYALPLFSPVMPRKYFQHLKKLVISLEILLSKNISRDHISIADKLLNEFVSDAPRLYTDNIVKSGLHELLHIAQCTIDIGPVNAFSCFPYEELNRKLLRLIKGKFLHTY